MGSRASSLRLKLTLWFVLVFSLIQAVLVLGVVLFRRGAIQRTLDQELEESAEAMVDNILNAEAAWEEEALADLIPSDSGFLLFAIRDAKGAGLVQWELDEVRDLPFSAWEVVPSGPQGAVITSIAPERAVRLTGEDESLRLITVPFRNRGEPFYFQAAVRDQVLEQLLGPFLDIVVIGVPIGILAALVAAWMIAGRAVAPIRRLSLAAQRVSPERLSERFQVRTTDEEISLLEHELNSALQRIEEGYAAQDQFISNVSHELKTPIAVLLTEAQVTRMGPLSEERGRRFVEKAEREMQRLGRLVESFLTLARANMSRGQPTEPVSVNDLVLECVQRSQALGELHGVRLVPQLVDGSMNGSEPMGADELEVAADIELLQTAIENLIRNALQHSPEGEVVRIVVLCTHDQVEIAVHDRGPGIPDEHLETVFDRFAQVPGRATPGGSGLGLAITKHVVELHGGTVAVRKGEGCCVVLRLPRHVGGSARSAARNA